MKAIKNIVHVLRLIVKYAAFVTAIIKGIQVTISELEKDKLIEKQ